MKDSKPFIIGYHIVRADSFREKGVVESIRYPLEKQTPADTDSIAIEKTKLLWKEVEKSLLWLSHSEISLKNNNKAGIDHFKDVAYLKLFGSEQNKPPIFKCFLCQHAEEREKER